MIPLTSHHAEVAHPTLLSHTSSVQSVDPHPFYSVCRSACDTYINIIVALFYSSNNLIEIESSFQCFTRGFEYKKHESDHRYEIMVGQEIWSALATESVTCDKLKICLQTSDFPVLEPGWTAQEEMALLEAVMDCGFGNWWVCSLGLILDCFLWT